MVHQFTQNRFEQFTWEHCVISRISHVLPFSKKLKQYFFLNYSQKFPSKLNAMKSIDLVDNPIYTWFDNPWIASTLIRLGQTAMMRKIDMERKFMRQMNRDY